MTKRNELTKKQVACIKNNSRFKDEIQELEGISASKGK
jgi:hypothetical protein